MRGMRWADSGWKFLGTCQGLLGTRFSESHLWSAGSRASFTGKCFRFCRASSASFDSFWLTDRSYVTSRRKSKTWRCFVPILDDPARRILWRMPSKLVLSTQSDAHVDCTWQIFTGDDWVDEELTQWRSILNITVFSWLHFIFNIFVFSIFIFKNLSSKLLSSNFLSSIVLSLIFHALLGE